MHIVVSVGFFIHIKILELGFNYGQSNKTIYTALDHWYSDRCHTSWHYDTYCFVTHENVTNQNSNTTNILQKRLLNIIKQICRKLIKIIIIHHYTVYPDTRYMDCVSWMRLCFILCCESCLYTHSRRYKQLGAYNRRVLLLYGGTVTAVWAVLFNICILEF